jgi:dienelactone hydrolase
MKEYKLTISTIYFILISIALLISGCSTEKEKSSMKSIEDSEKIISFKPIQVEGLNPSLDSYKMRYWSEGEETVAYVSLPKKEGVYNLTVVCHGGLPAPIKDTHIQSIEGISFDKTLLLNTSPEVIGLVPLYRGYGESNGTVPGLNGVTLDTSNAIDALTKYLEGNENRKSTGGVFVSGTSLGGGVALKLATLREDITDVVAVSPYVGLDIYYPWLLENPEIDIGFLDMFNEAYGDYDEKSEATAKESINFKKINVPVLIVQGDSDTHVDWRTVKMFYDKLKQENENTTFELISGGSHGLHNKQEELLQIIESWFKEQFH